MEASNILWKMRSLNGLIIHYNKSMIDKSEKYFARVSSKIVNSLISRNANIYLRSYIFYGWSNWMSMSSVHGSMLQDHVLFVYSMVSWWKTDKYLSSGEYHEKAYGWMITFVKYILENDWLFRSLGIQLVMIVFMFGMDDDW